MRLTAHDGRLMTSGTIRRAPRPADNFAQISNSALADPRLSWRATGVLAYLLSRPIGWSTTGLDIWKSRRSQLDGVRGNGRDAIFEALAELERCGYLVRRQYRDERGQWVWEHMIYDTPQEPDPDVDEPVDNQDPAVDNSTSGSPGTGPTSGSPGSGSPGSGPPGNKYVKKETKKETSTPGGGDVHTSPAAPVDNSPPSRSLTRPERCVDHQLDVIPPACGRCKDARLTLERVVADLEARPRPQCEHGFVRDTCPYCPGGRLSDLEAVS